jgi:hypothetical protein
MFACGVLKVVYDVALLKVMDKVELEE